MGDLTIAAGVGYGESRVIDFMQQVPVQQSASTVQPEPATSQPSQKPSLPNLNSGKFKILILIVAVLVISAVVASVYQKTRPKTEPQPTGETQKIFPEPKPVVLPSPGTVLEESRVFVTEQGFDKPEVKIKVGGKVTFTNSGQSDHQIASTPHPAHTAYPALNLGVIKPFESKALVFAKAGTYGYHDHLNPQAQGTVIVE